MRTGESIQTFSGNMFWPLDPRVEEIRIDDIAHSLSQQCRFAGHTKEFYSVAQHSVLVANLVPMQDKLWGLLHDASEAYLVDLPSPMKYSGRIGEEYQLIEKKVMDLVAERFGISSEQPQSIYLADKTMLATEIRDFMGSRLQCAFMPLQDVIHPWSSLRAEAEFLRMAEYLIPDILFKA